MKTGTAEPAEVASRWDESVAHGFTEAQLLLYRSQLLGSDLRVTNFAGGNTSAKIPDRDPLTGATVTVLWVKGSGGDLGSMQLDGFATLYLGKLVSLKELYRGLEHEDAMVPLLGHCTFNLNPRPASIDTPLHAFIPHRHVDHMHPDDVIAVAASRDGERLTREIWGGELGWLPWQRPGFDLALKLEAACRARPELRGIVLGGHGLFTWGETSKECYENTLRVIRRATGYLAERARGPAFGGAVAETLDAERRQEIVLRLLPLLRGAVGRERRKIGHFTDAPDVLEFVGSKRLEELAAKGTSCPDHFLRTKIRPLVVPADAGDVKERVEGYCRDYAAYYERCKRPDSPPLRDPNPVVILVPGAGMLTFARDKATARVAAEFYVNAIRVMRGATAVSDYAGLDEREAFGIEYWPLEEAKLQRMPPPKSLAGRVALVTGGGGGIGRAVAARLLAEGACVVLCDIDAQALESAHAELDTRFGADNVRGVTADVTREAEVAAAVESCALHFGGLDVLVSNAGIASSAPFEDTSVELWQRNMDILVQGYFLVSREAFKLMKRQGLGGSIVFVGSKNALAASTQAAAYNSAKAAELHLARCLALEGAEAGIRCNVVNPDAVLRGSRIWSGAWRKERAQAYGVEEQDLERHYRERSLLKRSVYPEDVAEAVYFFASDLSAKSTGNILNVDAGNLTAFPR
ncbi:MAG: bifunctional rhamnulose-1-phosphate aldolase/short-chain dehydrogenase [Planctomycetota bacterium]|nr:MAG: bifunctional rhamnulose-1-phosphate aldolase/short-chain dehydrogenase [Planctomycetota bacterium]